MSDKIRTLKKALVKLHVELGREPVDEELADYLKLDVKKIKSIKKAMIKEPVSLDTPVAQDLCLEDYIKDDFKRLPDIKTEKEFLYCELLTSKDQKLTPDFSFDITKGIAGGNTITYIALQICMYMGFAEIYLLGMDCSNFLHHFTDNYVDGKLEMDMNTLNVERMILAYKEAKRISEEKGIKIYNATRGGMLEVFERVNFDDLFKRQERDNRV